MRPELEGTGGGYGKFAGKTVGEIRELFAKCEEEPNMRSVSIVLRVAREQLDARGNLGYYPTFVIVAIVILAGSFVVKGFLPANIQATLPKLQLGFGLMVVALAIGVLKTSSDRRRAIAQERAIRDLSLNALDKIVSTPGFTAKPLDFTQDLTMKRLLGRAKNRPSATLLS